MTNIQKQIVTLSASLGVLCRPFQTAFCGCNGSVFQKTDEKGTVSCGFCGSFVHQFTKQPYQSYSFDFTLAILYNQYRLKESNRMRINPYHRSNFRVFPRGHRCDHVNFATRKNSRGIRCCGKCGTEMWSTAELKKGKQNQMTEEQTITAVINLLKNKIEVLSNLWEASEDSSDFAKGLVCILPV